MKIIHVNNNEIDEIVEPLCAAIGNFDGVHLGHQKLIEEAKKHNLKSAVLTFYPHPAIFLKNIKDYKILTPIDHKAEIFQTLGIDYLIVVDFNNEIANLSKDDFITLMKKLNIQKCVCGHDFSFGAKALGTPFDLLNNFDTYIIPKYVIDNVRVSTSYIKELLDDSNVSKAAELLGRYYSIRGEVVSGSQKGRHIGFPTANVEYNKYYLPENGVYYVKVKLDDVLYDGMCNIGNNPTFNFSALERLEVNIFGLDADLYGKELEVFFIKNIRNEKKFKSKEELIKQLNLDRNVCLELAKV